MFVFVNAGGLEPPTFGIKQEKFGLKKTHA